MTNYFYLVSVEVGNVADNIVEATFSNQVVSMDFSAGITIRVNGTPANIVSVKRLDGEKIIQYKIDVFVVSTDNVKLSYTALPATGLDRSSQYGDYVTSDYGTILLETFTNRVVTNNVPSNDPIGDALRADVVAYYKGDSLNDSSGNGHHLTNNNSVTFTPGLLGNAFTFSAPSTQYLSRANFPQTGDQTFTWVGWVRFSSLPELDARMTLINKYYFDGESIYNYEYDVYYAHFDEIGGAPGDATYADYSADSGAGVGDIDPFEHPETASLNTWYFVELQWVASTPVTRMRINLDTWLENTADLEFAGVSNTGDMCLGYDPIDLRGAMDGKMQMIGHWHRQLTETESAYLYNSGAGRTLYP